MKAFWNNRYQAETYAYGTAPNDFFASQLVNLKPGKILLPADGEGRNAVFAAKLGWEVTSFDLSAAGKQKAEKLAKAEGVAIKYLVGSAEDLSFSPNYFDAIALIFAHFPAAEKSKYHHKFKAFLKSNGTVIFEAFGKQHLSYNAVNPKVGGPRDLAMLFSTDEIRADFSDFDIQLLLEEEVDLAEGIYHLGKGSVVRFRGSK